jgi:hypothetical protein
MGRPNAMRYIEEIIANNEPKNRSPASEYRIDEIELSPRLLSAMKIAQPIAIRWTTRA